MFLSFSIIRMHFDCTEVLNAGFVEKRPGGTAIDTLKRLWPVYFLWNNLNFFYL